jgi:hypothetical protein
VVGRLGLDVRAGLVEPATMVFAGAAELPIVFACGGFWDVDAGGVIQEVSDCHVELTVLVTVLATVLSPVVPWVLSLLLAGSCTAGFAAEGVEAVAAGGDGGSGGVGADAAAGVAVAVASALLLESQSAAYVWSGLLQARPVSSIQPSVERIADGRRLVRCAGRSGRPVGPDSA